MLYHYWLLIEQINAGSLVFANILFLFLRSCMSHKIELNSEQKESELPSSDTCLALKSLMQQANSQFIPFLVALLL